jgi:uncharacterized DUF497 family protein
LSHFSYDPAKSEKNMALRGLSFELVSEFEWETSLIAEDIRHDYAEKRYQALGFIGMKLYMLVFTLRAELIHIISLRRANQRERKKYVTQTSS